MQACRVCGTGRLAEARGYAQLARVTSDSRPFRPGGRIAQCASCGAVQKFVDPAWLAEIGEIYGSYAMYYQSDEADQPVFRAGAAPRPRSAYLAEFLASSGVLPERGSALDVGCGNGAFLAALAAVRPDWELNGSDLGTSNLARLQRIPGFRELMVGGVETLPGSYDLVSMVHSLEHFPDPHAALVALRPRLSADGRLFIQVPDVTRTPFDLVVADHLCHFSAATLGRLARRAGYEVEKLSTAVIGKELTLVARPAGNAPAAAQEAPDEPALGATVDWLRACAQLAQGESQHQPFGLFGTSIAANWLFGALGERVSFFVDEDPGRIGKTLHGRPVLAPASAPAGAVLFVALIPEVATMANARLRHLPLRIVVPPPL